MKISKASLFWAILYTIFLVLWLCYFDVGLEILKPYIPNRIILVARTPLWRLGLNHFNISFIATLASVITAVLLAVIAWLSGSKVLKNLSISLGNGGETIPSVVIIALAVPMLGYGNGPLVLALFLYALLPVLRNTIIGLENIDCTMIEAAKGMGMTAIQRMVIVELPLALPVILSGIRQAVVINISATTIGATVGASGLGGLILSGIRTYDTLLILKGSVPVLLMALAAFNALSVVIEDFS